jgi:hypothetical protein
MGHPSRRFLDFSAMKSERLCHRERVRADIAASVEMLEALPGLRREIEDRTCCGSGYRFDFECGDGQAQNHCGEAIGGFAGGE